MRDVAALSADADHGPVGSPDGLVDEVENALLGGAPWNPLQADLDGAAAKRLPGLIEAVQQLEEALALDLGQGLPHGLAHHVAVTDQLQVGAVNELEDMR